MSVVPNKQIGKAKGMKRSQPKRDWHLAESKRGPCRICGAQPAHLHHLMGREHDKDNGYEVLAARVIPLCKAHHDQAHAHELDLLSVIDKWEAAQAVLDAGSLESARRRLAPSLYRQERAAA